MILTDLMLMNEYFTIDMILILTDTMIADAG